MAFRCEPFRALGRGFTVLAPPRLRASSILWSNPEKTPESVAQVQETALTRLFDDAARLLAKAVTFVRAAWGAESSRRRAQAMKTR